MSAPTEQEQVPNAPTNNLNVKQQNRIQKRRLAREKLVNHLALTRKNSKLHNAGGVTGSMRRPRGPDGRFLTPEQLTTQYMKSLTIQETNDKRIKGPMEKPKL
ncbi:hypothetical protein G6011_09434 [Alternaria panax]|uniref:Transcriptional activator HAP2 n=1 Tax=Alternaria panax TaxID=48097 RepID=A0AAD4NMM0_9PLEO|nr:hypothetical protein G6011_09434 [Alternaria panax]